MVNPDFDSNSYVLEPSDSPFCWVIDFGFVGNLDQLSKAFDKPVAGVFLTHCHYDHICGLQALVTLFPECELFGSPYTLTGIADSKLNLSYYKGFPVEIQHQRLRTIVDQENIFLSESLSVQIYSTPGHNAGCLSFAIEQYLFTGDSLIPGHKLVTKLKSGNRAEGKLSREKLIRLIDNESIICAGHGPPVLGKMFLNSPEEIHT